MNLNNEELKKILPKYDKNFKFSKFELKILLENVELRSKYFLECIKDNSDKRYEKIIRFCNLNWEDNCLSFHKNKTPIKTMSTAQARNPIYKSSMKSFEKYKNSHI